MKRRAAVATFIVTLFCAAVLWAVTASDNFPYSDGNLTSVTANWVTYFGFNEPNVASNKVRANATNTVSVAFYNAISPGNDQFIQWTVATMGGLADHSQSGYVRASAATTSYFCAFRSGTTVEIYEETASDGGVLIGSGSTGAVVATDIMKCQIIGTALIFFKNGSSVATANDPSITSGKPGIGLSTNADGAGVSENEIDDVSLGDVAVSSVQVKHRSTGYR